MSFSWSDIIEGAVKPSQHISEVRENIDHVYGNLASCPVHDSTHYNSEEDTYHDGEDGTHNSTQRVNFESGEDSSVENGEDGTYNSTRRVTYEYDEDSSVNDNDNSDIKTSRDNNDKGNYMGMLKLDHWGSAKRYNTCDGENSSFFTDRKEGYYFVEEYSGG